MKGRNTGAIGSLNKTFKILRDTPSLLIITFFWAAFWQLIHYFGDQSWIIVLLLLIPFGLLYPYYKGGFFSVVTKSQNEKKINWLYIFMEGGKKYYVSLLVGLVAYLGLIFALFMLIYFTSLFGMIAIALISGLLGIIHEFLSLALLILALLIFQPLITGILVCFHLFLQFYDIGIVASGYDVEKSFKKSINFTRAKFNAVVGYSFLKYVIMFVLYIPIMIYSFQNIPMDIYQTDPYQIPSNPLSLVIITIIFGTFYGAFSFSYHSTFFVQNVEEIEEPESTRRLLLKLYGIGFLLMILIVVFMALMFLLFGPELEEFARTSAELAETQQV
jgi:hypothetical protein